MKAKLTDFEGRQRNRLRSERYRRARGILPSRPAHRPRMALGVSRSHTTGGEPIVRATVEAIPLRLLLD